MLNIKIWLHFGRELAGQLELKGFKVFFRMRTRLFLQAAWVHLILSSLLLCAVG